MRWPSAREGRTKVHGVQLSRWAMRGPGHPRAPGLCHFHAMLTFPGRLLPVWEYTCFRDPERGLDLPEVPPWILPAPRHSRPVAQPGQDKLAIQGQAVPSDSSCILSPLTWFSFLHQLLLPPVTGSVAPSGEWGRSWLPGTPSPWGAPWACWSAAGSSLLPSS